MFTGIVERMALVVEVRSVAGGRRLRLDVGEIAGSCELGASVCVSGVCLTVADRKPPFIEFDIITETLDRSTLGGLAVGSKVNIERSLRVGDRLDGHFVQGHVDGTADVAGVESSPKAHVIRLHTPPSLRPYIVPKGSIAIDGVSLTIADAARGSFSVALIPTTLDGTTLGALRAGERVNIESDIVARTVVHHLSSLKQDAGLTLESLQKAGFA
jgi:riboflavin synthase